MRGSHSSKYFELSQDELDLLAVNVLKQVHPDKKLGRKALDKIIKVYRPVLDDLKFTDGRTVIHNFFGGFELEKHALAEYNRGAELGRKGKLALKVSGLTDEEYAKLALVEYLFAEILEIAGFLDRAKIMITVKDINRAFSSDSDFSLLYV